MLNAFIETIDLSVLICMLKKDRTTKAIHGQNTK